MRKIYGVILLLFLLVESCKENNDQEQIVNCFNQYKASILTGKGDEAIIFFDSRTIKYYDEIIEQIKTADSIKVESLPLLDKFTVLSFRYRVQKEDVLKMDGRKLLIYAIDNGMVGKSKIAEDKIGEIKIDGDFATAKFVINEEISSMSIDFYKEEGQWKIDLTSIFLYSTIALREMLEKSGRSENDYLFSIIEALTGRKPSAEIWEPLR